MTSNLLLNIITDKIIHYIKISYNTTKLIFSKEKPLIAYWWREEGGINWGDALNPILIQKMSGKLPISADEIINFRNEPVYSVVGSILGFHNDINQIVWGSGFISSSSRFEKKPRRICAVRGPLTRDLIIKQGIDCPEIYGDPALLYPLFYRPTVEKKYQLGIIPHYVDQNHPLLSIFKNNPEVLIIDIAAGINEVIDNICMCKLIASSSLHGIIAADAYEIPSIWIKISDKVTGQGFKFFDYFLSVGRINEKPLLITKKTTLHDINNRCHKYNIDIDLIKLIEACPFISDSDICKLKKGLKQCW